MEKNRRTGTRDLCLVAVFAAVMAVSAQIIIPMPLGVPLTMQTFAVCFAGVLLGPRRGALAALVYLVLGGMGAPVFSGFMGGLQRLAGPTGGFLLSYPLMAWLVGWGGRRGDWRSAVAGIALGLGANYALGTLMFHLLTGSGLLQSFAACVLPFIPVDIAKAAGACILGAKVRARIPLSA